MTHFHLQPLLILLTLILVDTLKFTPITTLMDSKFIYFTGVSIQAKKQPNLSIQKRCNAQCHTTLKCIVFSNTSSSCQLFTTPGILTLDSFSTTAISLKYPKRSYLKLEGVMMYKEEPGLVKWAHQFLAPLENNIIACQKFCDLWSGCNVYTEIEGSCVYPEVGYGMRFVVLVNSSYASFVTMKPVKTFNRTMNTINTRTPIYTYTQGEATCDVVCSSFPRCIGYQQLLNSTCHLFDTYGKLTASTNGDYFQLLQTSPGLRCNQFNTFTNQTKTLTSTGDGNTVCYSTTRCVKSMSDGSSVACDQVGSISVRYGSGVASSDPTGSCLMYKQGQNSDNSVAGVSIDTCCFTDGCNE